MVFGFEGFPHNVLMKLESYTFYRNSQNYITLQKHMSCFYSDSNTQGDKILPVNPSTEKWHRAEAAPGVANFNESII